MNAILNIVCWKSEEFWLGKVVNHPEIMSRGEALEELGENLPDAYREMLLDGLPPDHRQAWPRTLVR